MPYDPTSKGNRTYLALALKSMLTEAGFVKLEKEVIDAEAQYSKSKKPVKK